MRGTSVVVFFACFISHSKTSSKRKLLNRQASGREPTVCFVILPRRLALRSLCLCLPIKSQEVPPTERRRLPQRSAPSALQQQQSFFALPQALLSCSCFPKFIKKELFVGLKDKILLITASTRGIGLDTVKACVKEGAMVYMAARNPERAKAEADKLNAQGCRVKHMSAQGGGSIIKSHP